MNCIRIFIIFIIISIFKKSNQVTNIPLQLPASLTLLDNSILLISHDGIHFFDEELIQEFESKKIDLTVENNDIQKNSMAQFQNGNYPYILIYLKNTIYIFNNERTLLKEEQITDDDCNNGIYMSLIPYKKVDNSLYFFISNLNNNNIYLFNICFDLTNYNNNLSINKQQIKHIRDGESWAPISGLSCVLMPPYEALNINYDLLTCFYFRTSPLEFCSFTLELRDSYIKNEA